MFLLSPLANEGAEQFSLPIAVYQNENLSFFCIIAAEVKWHCRPHNNSAYRILDISIEHMRANYNIPINDMN
jgi:hypothetical protein